MARYLVVVTIENKDQVGDPEGETIKNDLILKSGYSNVESVGLPNAITLSLTQKLKMMQKKR